jgi:hypothetical protein
VEPYIAFLDDLIRKSTFGVLFINVTFSNRGPFQSHTLIYQFLLEALLEKLWLTLCPYVVVADGFFDESSVPL